MGKAWTGAALAAVLLGAAAAGCSTSSVSTPNGSITLYSGQHQQTTESLVTGFEKATGIRVNVRYNDEDTFVDQIVTEGSNSPADLIYTENSPALMDLESHHLLAPLPGSTLSQVPSTYNSPGGDWVAASARVSVIVYNPKRISASQLPTSILQLADPRYKGKLALAPSETDFQPIVTAVAQAYGSARAVTWLKGVASNAASHTFSSNEAVTINVNAGQAAFAVINQYYWYRLGSQIGTSNLHSKLAYFGAQDPGYVVDVSGIGVLSSSHHQAASDRFAAYVVSPAGQEIIARSQSYEYPLAPGVAPQAAETPLSSLQPYPISISELGTGSTALSLLRQAGLL